MMEWMFFISNTILAIGRLLLGMFLVCRVLSSEKIGKKCITMAMLGGLLSSVVFFSFQGGEICGMAWEALIVVVCARRFLQTDARKTLFLCIMYEIAVSLWMFLISAGLGILFRSASFLERETFQGQCAAWVLHLLLLALWGVFLRKEEIQRRDAFRVATRIALVGFLAVVTLSNQDVLPIPQDTFTMWMIQAMILLMALLVYHMTIQYEVERELAQLKDQQAELLKRDYTALNEAYSVNAKLFHDFHNHIGALRHLMAQESYDKAIEYLDELQQPILEMTHRIWTGDETVDYLINSKLAVAEENQIQLQVQVEFPRHTNVQSADLCAILGNLLDNALEAVKNNKESKDKKVTLTIRRIHQMLVIKVENPFSGSVTMENGAIQTTKKEEGLHGWGLKSAQTAAEKYDGMVRITTEGNMFCAVATLSYEGITIE